MNSMMRYLSLPWQWVKTRRLKPSVLLKIYQLLGWDIQKSPNILRHIFNTSKADFLLADWQEKYVVARRDLVIGRAVFCSGEFELDKFDKARALLGQDTGQMAFVDIGANIGTMCIPMIARGHFARAIAIEPEPLNARLLSTNIHLNNVADQIEVFEAALGDSAGSAKLYMSTTNFGDHLLSPDGTTVENRQSVEVDVKTLDELIPLGERSNLFLWLDTQGYEGFVLKSASAILADAPPMVLEFDPDSLGIGQAYETLCTAVLNAPYTKVYDLDEANPVAVPVTAQALDALFQEYNRVDGFTDLLFIK